jgi:LacI family transcriptional regulator
MPKRRAGTNDANGLRDAEKPSSLKNLADYLGLAPATISLVLNGAAIASTISPETKKLIFAAAREFNYRPNFFARCLRTRRSFAIGVMVPEVSEGYNATVLSGIEDHLLQEGYFYFVVSHRFRTDLIDEYVELFLHRSVDGLIVVNTPWQRELSVPVVTVSCHHTLKDVPSIVLDHHVAAEVALKHLISLGHNEIAFIKGQSFVPDTEVRWKAIVEVAGRLGFLINPKLVTQIEDNSPLPQLGYHAMQKLLAEGRRPTALFAFNDICAMGAIRAFHEFGLRVPEDISVVGFDDIVAAAYQSPGLTTVQQPLRKMGRMAAESVLRQIVQTDEQAAEHAPAQIVIEPELIVRGTTAPIAQSKSAANNSAKNNNNKDSARLVAL